MVIMCRVKAILMMNLVSSCGLIALVHVVSCMQVYHMCEPLHI